MIRTTTGIILTAVAVSVTSAPAHGQAHASFSVGVGPLFAGVSVGIGTVGHVPGSVFLPASAAFPGPGSGWGTHPQGASRWTEGYWDASYIRPVGCWDLPAWPPYGWHHDAWAYDPWYNACLSHYRWYRPWYAWQPFGYYGNHWTWSASLAWGWGGGWHFVHWVDPFRQPWAVFAHHDPWSWYGAGYADGYRDGFWDGRYWGGRRVVYTSGSGRRVGYGYPSPLVAYKEDPRSRDQGRRASSRGAHASSQVAGAPRTAQPRGGTGSGSAGRRTPPDLRTQPTRTARTADRSRTTDRTARPRTVRSQSTAGRADSRVPSRRFSPPVRTTEPRPTRTTGKVTGATRTRVPLDRGSVAKPKASDRSARPSPGPATAKPTNKGRSPTRPTLGRSLTNRQSIATRAPKSSRWSVPPAFTRPPVASRSTDSRLRSQPRSAPSRLPTAARSAPRPGTSSRALPSRPTASRPNATRPKASVRSPSRPPAKASRPPSRPPVRSVKPPARSRPTVKKRGR